MNPPLSARTLAALTELTAQYISGYQELHATDRYKNRAEWNLKRERWWDVRYSLIALIFAQHGLRLGLDPIGMAGLSVDIPGLTLVVAADADEDDLDEGRAKLILIPRSDAIRYLLNCVRRHDPKLAATLALEPNVFQLSGAGTLDL
jgi:hypothetical protein